MQKFDVPPLTMYAQKPVKVNKSVLVLEDDYISYIMDFIAEVPVNRDAVEYSEWQEEHIAFDLRIYKERISGMEITFVAISKCWGLYLKVQGFQSDLGIFFKTRIAAEKLRDAIHVWRKIPCYAINAS